jgi:glycosyltransferase involved in cell wall biosynthesis
VPDWHRGLDIVFLYAPPWTGPTRFSKHHLASYFGRSGARVLYVEAPLTPVGLRRGRVFIDELRATQRPPTQFAERLWVRRYFLPIPYHASTSVTGRRAANRLGQRLLAPVLRRDFARLRFDRPILIAGLPHAADLAPLLTKRALVYHCADDYSNVRGFPSTLPALEAELCQQANLVITTSETLCQERRPFNPNTHWVPNGADVEHFSQLVTPAAELCELQHPIVGFVGGLSEWVDLSLVAQLARARPRWTFAFIGPVAIDTAPVSELGNVRLLGPRPYAALPSYFAAMDVGLIPFKHNRLTYHADPIKAYEYLASGLPVVASDLPALRRLAPLVRLASSVDSFIDELDAAIDEGREARRAARQAAAARHSWTARFQAIDRLLCDVLSCES